MAGPDSTEVRPFGVGGGDVDVTMQAFAQWLSEMKARSNNSLQQMLAEMGIIRDGITSNSTDLTEFKRHSISIQQQMQSQLTDLREKLTSAFGEITSLVKQKTATDQELMSEINALQQQLSMKTAELDALKKSYSSTHQQLQNHLIQIQSQLQSTNSEIQAAKKHAQAVQEGTVQKMNEVEGTVQRITQVLDSTSREGHGHAMLIQEDIAKIHEAMTSLSADFYDHKRLTISVQNKLMSQVSMLEETRRRGGSGTAANAPERQASTTEFEVQERVDPLVASSFTPPVSAPGTTSSLPPMTAPAGYTTTTTLVQPVGQPQTAVVYRRPQ